MKTTIFKEYDKIFEASALLTLIAEDFHYEELMNRLITKYRIEDEIFEKYFKKINKIYLYVKKQLESDREKIDFYYKNIGEYSDNIASFVLLNEGYHIYHSTQELKEHVLNIKEEERLKEFACRLDGMLKLGLTEDSDYEDFTMKDLIRKINKAELDAQKKLTIQQIYLDKEYYLDEILPLIQKTIDLFEDFKEDLILLASQFYDTWTSFIESIDIHDYLKEQIGVTFEKNSKGTNILPSIFYCNQASFCSDPTDNSSKERLPDLFHIGIIFNERFTLSSQLRDLTSINQMLKLLSDKSKFEILMLIKDKSSYGSELAKSLNLSTPTISYHMAALIQLGLVKIEKINNKVYYSSNKTSIEGFLNDIRRLLIE